MQTLREAVQSAREKKIALGHFNISDSNQLKAAIEAAKETGLPVLIGLSEGERDFFPLEAVRPMIDWYNKLGLQIYLNADHTYSIEKARAAIDAGVDSIVIDGAKLPHDENFALVSACVQYARASGREVLVEGELGYIGQSSQVVEKIPEGAAVTEEMMTKVDAANDFIQKTGIDMLAPAVGNIHGIVASGQPKLSISRIQELATSCPVPLVLHGGSGSPDEEFVAAIKAGIAIIHINTDLRILYKKGIERGLQESAKDVAPYKFLAPAVDDMKKFIGQKMRLFAGR
jgi:fructose-bisphosphate aldolase class II